MWYFETTHVYSGNLKTSKKEIIAGNYRNAANYFDSRGMFDYANYCDDQLSRVVAASYDPDDYDGYDYPISESRAPATTKWMQSYPDIFNKGKRPSLTEGHLEPYTRYRHLTMPSRDVEAIAPHLQGINPYELRYLMSPAEPDVLPSNPELSNQMLRSRLQYIQDQGIDPASDDYRRALMFYALSPLHRQIPFKDVRSVWDDPKHQQYTYGNLTDSPNFENPLRDRAASLLYYDTPEERENATWKMGLPRPPLGYGYAHTKNWKPEDQFNANKALLHDRILKNQDWWKPHNNYTLEGVAKAYSTEFGKTLTNGELLIYSSFMNRGYNEEQSIQQFQDWMAKFNKIYRLSREDSVYDSVIGFFAEHPDALGAPLKQVVKVMDKAAEYGRGVYSTDLQRLLSAFGNSMDQWVARFGGDAHAAAQWIPKGNTRDLNSLGSFLMQHYGKTNEDTLMQIAQGWKDLTPDQRKLSLDEMVKVIVQKNLHKIFGQGTHVENMDFAMEAAKWWQEDEADDWHGDEDDYDDDDDDVTYESLEEKFLESQEIPLPAFANVQPVTIGGLTGRFLPRSDPRGMFLGQYSASCQHPWNAGADCAYHGQTSPNGAFFVVEDDKHSVIAQSWVWQDRDGDVVFDNVEAKGIGPKRMPIVRKIYETVASQMPGADIVAIGKGGSDLDLTGLKPLNTPLKPFDYDGYRDSAQQVLLKQVPNEL